MCIKYTLHNSIKITRRPVTKHSTETYDYEGHTYTLDKVITYDYEGHTYTLDKINNIRLRRPYIHIRQK